jgi:hypothetical protein
MNATPHHHHVWMGGTPQARVQAFHEALERYTIETATLREQCWLLLSRPTEALAWQEDERFNGLRVMTWFNWAKHWLDVSFAMAPAVMRETLDAMGLREVELAQDATHWHHHRERWHVMAMEELPLLLEGWLFTLNLEASKQEEWRSLLPELGRTLVDSRHVEDWYGLVAKRFPTVWNDDETRQPLAELLSWVATRTLARGVVPAGWVQMASLCLLQFMKREHPERLNTLFKPLALVTMEKCPLLKEDAYEWVSLLASQGIDIWTLGESTTFRTRLETLPLAAITPDERETLPLMRPAFWDAMKQALHPHTPALTVVEDALNMLETDATTPLKAAGETFQTVLFQRWEGHSSTSLHSASGVFFTRVEGSFLQEQTLVTKLFRWFEAVNVSGLTPPKSAPTEPFTVLCQGANEKQRWQQVIATALGLTSDVAFGLQWFTLAQQLLMIVASAPWPSTLRVESPHPPPLTDFIPNVPQPWQLPPQVWLESPAWAEGVHIIVNECWLTLESHHPIGQEAFQQWWLKALNLLETLKTTPHTHTVLPEWLFAWQQPIMQHPMVLPTATSLLAKLAMASRGIEFTLGVEATQVSLLAWATWLFIVLAGLSHQPTAALQTLRHYVQVCTLEEAPTFKLHHVVVPSLFQPARVQGFGQLMEEAAPLSALYPSESTEAYNPLATLETSLHALQHLETLSHAVAGAKQLHFIVNTEQLSEYPQEYHPLLTRLLPEVFEEVHPAPLEDKGLSNVKPPTEENAPLHAIREALSLKEADALHYLSYGANNTVQLSPSAIEAYAKCPRQLYYKRFRFPKPSYPASAKGSLIHGLLERFHGLCNAHELPFTMPALVEMASSILNTESPIWQPPEGWDKKHWLRTYCQLPLMLRKQWQRDILEGFEHLETTGFFERTPTHVDSELKLSEFYMPQLPGFQWNLSIDAVFNYPEGDTLLVDYKTYAHKLTEKKSETREAKVNKVTTALSPRADGASGYPASFTEFWYSQLPLYILAYENRYPEAGFVKQAGLQLLRSPRKVEVGSCFVPYDVATFREQQEDWLEALNTELIQPLFHERTFTPNPDATYCKQCDYTFICDKQAPTEDDE